MLSTPTEIGVTTPAIEEIVATVVVLLVQSPAPPPDISVSGAPEIHTLSEGVNGAGLALTVMI